MKSFLKIFKLLIFLSIFLYSCKNNAKDDEKSALLEYLEKNKIETEPTGSGLYYIETDTADYYDSLSVTPQKGDIVVLKYKGSLIDKTIFDQTDTNYFHYIFKEQSVIKGWEEGVSYMKKGISAKLIIPSDLAYGKYQTGKISPYSTLIFEIEMIDKK